MIRSKFIVVNGTRIRVYSHDGKLWSSRPSLLHRFEVRKERDITNAGKQFNRIMDYEERKYVY